MDDKQREEMNQKIDILFEQIEKLDDGNKEQAVFALSLWKSAKTCEFLGLGPMEARHEYKKAHSILGTLGLEIGGMIEPLERADFRNITIKFRGWPLADSPARTPC